MTPEQAIDHIRAYLPALPDVYNRLIIVTGQSGTGKTAVLRALRESEHVPLISLGAELSSRLLDIPERQRPLQLPMLLNEAVGHVPSEIALLDNTELLFCPLLKQDPLRLLQRTSRNRTVIASWLGSVVDGQLIYATQNHPEFRRYPTEDLLVVALNERNERAAHQVER